MLIFLASIVACTSDGLENEQTENYVDCELVYSSFTKVLRGLDDVNLISEDVDEYINIVVNSFQEEGIVDPSIFENSALITKSQVEDFYSNQNIEDCINALSANFESELAGQIWNEMVYALIQGGWNKDVFLNKIEKSSIKNADKEYLAIVLAVYNDIYKYPVLSITKGSFDDCFSSYLHGLSNARRSAALGVFGGPVGLIAASLVYRVAVDELERGFNDCVR